MKALGFVAAIMLVCLAGVAQADTSLLTNGGFSTGDFTGWTTHPTPAVGINAGSDPNACLEEGWSQWAAIEQAVTNHPLALGETYTVSLQARYEDSTANQLALYFQTSGGATTLLEEHIGLTASFVTHTYTYNVDPSVVNSNWRIYLQADGPNAQQGGWMDVDNVAVTATTTPEPTMITLLITGLIGLLAYAWRKRR